MPKNTTDYTREYDCCNYKDCRRRAEVHGFCQEHYEKIMEYKLFGEHEHEDHDWDLEYQNFEPEE